MRSVAAVVAIVASVCACAAPSPLELAPSADPHDDTAAWHEMARRARPFDVASSELDAALAATTDADKIAALEAWMAAGGRLWDVPPRRPVEAGDDALAVVMAAIAAAQAGATDDRALAAALYTAQRLRRDGADLTANALAVAIVRKAIAARPHAPTFAAAFAPTDDEVARGFAAEAMAISRYLAWSTTADAARLASDTGASYRDLARTLDENPLDKWSWIATAPTDRDGLLAAIGTHIGNDNQLRDSLLAQAHKLYDSVDAYRRWMATSAP
jgi:hypothetical protein